ncbi:hypothetical protein F4780DRAFT_399915 [Xylariomycetidae sp. FL0641]|nr:hypothetical protein F4780DRAFT_399915 [Xylariomycetidae sp. FL0641]
MQVSRVRQFHPPSQSLLSELGRPLSHQGLTVWYWIPPYTTNQYLYQAADLVCPEILHRYRMCTERTSQGFISPSHHSKRNMSSASTSPRARFPQVEDWQRGPGPAHHHQLAGSDAPPRRPIIAQRRMTNSPRGPQPRRLFSQPWPPRESSPGTSALVYTVLATHATACARDVQATSRLVMGRPFSRHGMGVAGASSLPAPMSRRSPPRDRVSRWKPRLRGGRDEGSCRQAAMLG